MLMTAEALRGICKEHKLYLTPELNDKLYCNFQGFSAIGGLEAYTGVRALFLEGNAIESLDGFVQNNVLQEINHLDRLESLDTLNVSNNRLTRLDNLACCKHLCTLLAAGNSLSTLASVAHLTACTQLSTLDLQDNELADPELLGLLRKLPALRALYLRGNPVVGAIRSYRKATISALPALSYLDDRPITITERRCAEAWARGGLEAERAERQRAHDEERAQERANFEHLQAVRARGFQKRRVTLGLPSSDEDPFFDTVDQEHSAWKACPCDEGDPPELVAARQRLANLAPRNGEDEPPELTEARAVHCAAGGVVRDAEWAPLMIPEGPRPSAHSVMPVAMAIDNECTAPGTGTTCVDSTPPVAAAASNGCAALGAGMQQVAR